MIPALVALLAFATPPLRADDWGYRFSEKTMSCRRPGGGPAGNLDDFNLRYLGECGYFVYENLDSTTLEGGNLRGLRVFRSSLNNAHLRRCDLRSSSIRFSQLNGAWLDDSDLRGADLEASSLIGATLLRVRAGSADLSRSNLRRASLWGADLTSANLRAARLTDASLADADLVGADLRDADLINANVTSARFYAAKFNGCTRLPFPRAEAVLRGMLFISEPGCGGVAPDVIAASEPEPGDRRVADRDSPTPSEIDVAGSGGSDPSSAAAI